jgi:sulfatase maturation enzyme AslB (radical SAM superfamily)
MNINKDHLLKESKNFCMAPWIHMHVWPNGRAFPCCLSEHTSGKDYGNTNTHTLHELWNSELARSLRTNMIADKPSSVCTRCYELEADSNAYTLRVNMNNKFGPKHFDKVLTTHADGSHDDINFTYMDFRFSNLCNMSCRTCSPTFSTQWYDDYIKLYGSVDKSEAEQKYIQLKNKPGFMDELWPLLDTVEEVYWAGGEPLVTDVHWDIMNHWINTGRAQDISILYTTNFSNLYYKKQCVLDLWKKFKSVRVTASLDASHARAEYIRKGTVWGDIVANRKQMQQETPNIEFDITPTVSIMNVWHLPDFHREWVDTGYIKSAAMRINNLLDPKYFCMQVLPLSFKKEITDKWHKHIDYILSLPDYDPGQRWEESAVGLVDFLNKQDRSDMLPQALVELERWDVVRNEQWWNALPELNFLKDYK